MYTKFLLMKCWKDLNFSLKSNMIAEEQDNQDQFQYFYNILLKENIS